MASVHAVSGFALSSGAAGPVGFQRESYPGHHGLAHWMERVLKELDHVRKQPDADAVHDLRVAIRRCRSLGAVMQEVDADPSWSELRRLPRKLFRRLGALRDSHILQDWLQKLAEEHDAVQSELKTSFEAATPELQQRASRAAENFDEKRWKRLQRRLRRRSRLVPVGSLAAQCLAVERLEEARDLHAIALRSDKPGPWHELRIGIKRFRYTVESLLPEHYAAWSDNVKRLQDLLGDVHDLDVLAAAVKQSAKPENLDAQNAWQEKLRHERTQRIETYQQLTLGKTSLWNDWRHGLPYGKRLALASMARLRASARAADTRPVRTAHVSRLAVALFDAFRRVHAAPIFGEHSMRRVLRAAARLQRIGNTENSRSPQKASLRRLRSLPIPPSWTFDEWQLLGLTIRYHRGGEPNPDRGPFARCSEDEQKNVRALAGILRLARVLRKISSVNCTGMYAEKTADAILLFVPGLTDSVEIAARLAAGKHLLETYLGKPLVLKAAPLQENVIGLPTQPAVQAHPSAAAS
jgi:CHAD domain-containing protein